MKKRKNSKEQVASIGEVDDGNPWFFDIKNFIEKGIFPEYASSSDKKVVKRMTLHYTVVGGLLYQRSFLEMLLRCLDDSEKQTVIEEAHSRVSGGHVNTQILTKKINRIGYYWPTMGPDCLQFVKKCMSCQIYRDKIHTPSSSLHPLISPWPFSIWAFDVVGPLQDMTNNTN